MCVCGGGDKGQKVGNDPDPKGPTIRNTHARRESLKAEV